MAHPDGREALVPFCTKCNERHANAEADNLTPYPHLPAREVGERPSPNRFASSSASSTE